jgi:hypothetical protein
VALACGDEAPAAVRELRGSGHDRGGAVGSEHEQEHEHGPPSPPMLQRGSIVEFRTDGRADFLHRSKLSPDSPELLLLCGDLRCFRVVEAPLRAFLEGMVGAADGAASAPPSLFAKDMGAVDSVALMAMLAIIAALIVLGAWVGCLVGWLVGWEVGWFVLDQWKKDCIGNRWK